MKKQPLLPCPFCGGQPELTAQYERQGTYRSRIEITCTCCLAAMASDRRNASAKALRVIQQQQLEQEWNTRVINSNPTEATS